MQNKDSPSLSLLLMEKSVHFMVNRTISPNLSMSSSLSQITSNDSKNYMGYHQPRVKHTDKIIIYSILFIIASIGNTTSFIALLFMNRLNRSKNFTRIRMLFMNLCIADLMVTYIHLPLEIIWAFTDVWLAGEIMCKLMMFLRTFGLYLSSFVIITITIDRFYVIVKPLELERVYRLNKILLAMSWIVSFLSSLPQIYVFEIHKHPKDPTFKQCATFRILNTRTAKLIYNLYHFIGCYGMPLLIMIYCYTIIFSTIATHSKNKQKNKGANNKKLGNFRSLPHLNSKNSPSPSLKNVKSASFKYGSRSCTYQVTSCNDDSEKSDYGVHVSSNFNGNKLIVPQRCKYELQSVLDPENLFPENELIRRNTNKTYLKAKFRTLRLSALIVIAYLFSWTPYYICVLWVIISPRSFDSTINKKISHYLFTFAVSNSCFNPIVYGIFSNKLYQFLPCLQKKDSEKILIPAALIESNSLSNRNRRSKASSVF